MKLPNVSMLVCLVGLEQRRAGEADEHRARQQLLHGVVHLAGLRAVSLVDEDEDVALGSEVLRDLRAQFLDELAVGLGLVGLAVGAAELVDQRADQPLVSTCSACRAGRSPLLVR